jgi:carboxylesterase type B
VRFAATGDPNGGELRRWPAYRAEDDPYLAFDDAIYSGMNLRRRQMNFLDSYFASMKEA